MNVKIIKINIKFKNPKKAGEINVLMDCPTDRQTLSKFSKYLYKEIKRKNENRNEFDQNLL